MDDVIYLSIMISHLLICILSVLLVSHCPLAILFLSSLSFSSSPPATISLLIRLLNHHRSAHRASRICAKMTSTCEDCTFSFESIQRNGKLKMMSEPKPNWSKISSNSFEFMLHISFGNNCILLRDS